MKISLPKNYSFNESAYVHNGILYIESLDSYRALMYDITYTLKWTARCSYCSKKIKRRKTATLDHIIPQDLGGPTIPENLSITCPDCNSLKSNMSEQEFLHFLTLDPGKQKVFFDDLQLYKEYLNKRYVPLLPEEWLTYMSADEITVYPMSNEGTKCKSYKRVTTFYKKYNRLGKPVIVDKDYKLLDGFYTVLFAKNNSIDSIPTIILENVELCY